MGLCPYNPKQCGIPPTLQPQWSSVPITRAILPVEDRQYASRQLGQRLPGYRSGQRAGLLSRWAYARAGSNPAPGAFGGIMRLEPHYCREREKEIECGNPLRERMKHIAIVSGVGASIGSLTRMLLRRTDRYMSRHILMLDDIFDPLVSAAGAEFLYLLLRTRGHPSRRAKLLAISAAVGGRAVYELLEHLGYKTPISAPTWGGSAKDLIVTGVSAAAALYYPQLLKHAKRLAYFILRRLRRSNPG